MESIHKVVVLGASNSKRHYPTWVDYLETNSEIINLAWRGRTCDLLLKDWLENKHLKPNLVIIDVPPFWRFNLGGVVIGGDNTEDDTHSNWMRKMKVYGLYKRRYHDRGNFEPTVNSLHKHRFAMEEQNSIYICSLLEMIKLQCPSYLLPQLKNPKLDTLHYDDEQHRQLAKKMAIVINKYAQA